MGGSQIKGESLNEGEGALKGIQFAGRFGGGYVCTLPNINLNPAGLLTCKAGQQVMNESDDGQSWTIRLNNACKLCAQPGYYILPLRTYGTTGYARAKRDGSGQPFDFFSVSSVRGAETGQPSGNVNGCVFGIGVKYASIPLTHLYVGGHYSSKSIDNSVTVNLDNGTSTLVGYETRKIKTDIYPMTVGYYFREENMKKLLKLSIAATAAATTAAATLSSTALFADPFSGVIVEGALGRVRSQIESQTEGNSALKDTKFSGRVGVGYGYTFPDINLNLAGVLTYNVGQQKLEENRSGFANPSNNYWTTTLKNAWELRLQPGYYILPIRTLVYGTIGYAQTKLDISGRISGLILGGAGGSVRGTATGQGNANTNGYVLGIGAKYAPIPPTPLYVGVDYSHISYKRKVIDNLIRVDWANGTFELAPYNTGKMKTDTFLVTVGYDF